MRHYYKLESARPFNLEGGGQNGVVEWTPTGRFCRVQGSKNETFKMNI